MNQVSLEELRDKIILVPEDRCKCIVDPERAEPPLLAKLPDSIANNWRKAAPGEQIGTLKFKRGKDKKIRTKKMTLSTDKGMGGFCQLYLGTKPGTRTKSILLFDSNPKDESVKGKKGIFRVVGSAPVMLHKFVSNEQLQKSLAELHSATNATKHLPIRAKEKDEETWDLIPTSGGIGLSLQAQPMQKTKSWRLDALKQEVNSILGRDGSVSFNDLMEQTRAAKTKLMTVLKDIARKNDRGEWELKLKF
ncbi:hypothetical protein ADUPG1_008059 [Aduncisulcus paluster]|uniref:Transcription initiation factor IIF subunit beta n=1 Tax=Aduncisulcus paluster TaxID=2918883 RepID=A0ABQ5KQM5_9EUKA|nr:hypothetical protein ADUPG1_008059 [Aduncisulcus paluster]